MTVPPDNPRSDSVRGAARSGQLFDRGSQDSGWQDTCTSTSRMWRAECESAREKDAHGGENIPKEVWTLCSRPWLQMETLTPLVKLAPNDPAPMELLHRRSKPGL